MERNQKDVGGWGNSRTDRDMGKDPEGNLIVGSKLHEGG